MGFDIKMGRCTRPCLCFLCFEGFFQNPLHACVNLRFQETPLFDRLLHFPVKKSAAIGHFQIASCFQSGYPVVHCSPVCHHHPLKFPFLAQNICQKPLIVTGKCTVDLIIRTHHRIRLRLFDRHFKCRQIDFSKCPFIHHAVPHHTVLFLIVGRKVFQAGTHALTLNAFDPACAHHSGQIRIFAEVFKITPAQRIAFDVYPRPQNNVHTILQRFLCDGLSHFL